MTDTIKAVAEKIMGVLHYECQPDKGDIFAFCDDIKTELAKAAIEAMKIQPLSEIAIEACCRGILNGGKCICDDALKAITEDEAVKVMVNAAAKCSKSNIIYAQDMRIAYRALLARAYHKPQPIEDMQVREMTVYEVADYLDSTFFKKLESTGVDSLNSTEAAQALAKLGCIRIVGEV